jgi:hypothetical protein
MQEKTNALQILERLLHLQEHFRREADGTVRIEPRDVENKDIDSATIPSLESLSAVFRVTSNTVDKGGPLKEFVLEVMGDAPSWARDAAITIRLGTIDPTVNARFPIGGQVTLRLEDFWPKD